MVDKAEMIRTMFAKFDAEAACLQSRFICECRKILEPDNELTDKKRFCKLAELWDAYRKDIRKLRKREIH